MGRRFLQLNGYKRALGTIPRPDLKPWPVFGHVLIRAGPHYNHREAGGDKLLRRCRPMVASRRLRAAKKVECRTRSQKERALCLAYVNVLFPNRQPRGPFMKELCFVVQR